MNHQTFAVHLITIILAFFLVAPLLNIFASAWYDEPFPDAYDLWNYLEESRKTYEVYDYLSSEGWVDKRVSYEEFDYIFVLAQQLSQFATETRFPLILAMMAQESKFYQQDEYEGAIGLMQLLPIYHTTRMEKYVEADHQIDLDDFYNPRLNIITAIDYMDELLGYTKGDEQYALMCYNQGPASARQDYSQGYISDYANRIYQLSFQIEQILGPLE